LARSLRAVGKDAQEWHDGTESRINSNGGGVASRGGADARGEYDEEGTPKDLKPADILAFLSKLEAHDMPQPAEKGKLLALLIILLLSRAWSRSSLATSQGDFPAGVILALGWGYSEYSQYAQYPD
jgi:hypothetical protein